jgi:hypothetical protein
MWAMGDGSITDRHVAAALRPFVRATVPVLDALREADPFGLRGRRPVGSRTDAELAVRGRRERMLDRVAAVRLPGTAAWAAMNPAQRTAWWVDRVGAVTSLLASVPGLGGALADRLPVQDTLGIAGQGLVLCAVAGEYGLHDEADLVRLLAAVLFGRTMDQATAAGRDVRDTGGGDSADRVPADRVVGEITGELDGSRRSHGRLTIGALGRAVWRLGRLLSALGDELGKRPQGRFYHRLLGMLPVVGMIGDYFGERSALRRVTLAGTRWLGGRARDAGRPLPERA